MDRAIQIVLVAVAFPMMTGVVIFLSGPRYPIDFWPRLILCVAVVGAADLFCEAYISVRRAELTAEGATFYLPFHHVRTRRDELRPAGEPPQYGVWGISYTRRGSRKSPTRMFTVTLEQARAILAYPGAPKWPVRPEILESLGG
jgi:hypothetical protein